MTSRSTDPPAPPSQQVTVAPSPLLEMKLYVPASQGGPVPRPRLSERLDRGTASRLTLVSAPAGFGKTTLLAQWLAAGPAAPSDPRSAAWLSLDREDNDPTTFWVYVIAALRTVAPGTGASALALLQAPQPPPIQTILTTLINDLDTTLGDIVLVLDDYHLVDAREVHEGMAFLLDHLPARLHLVIASRADPPLPLARLRARGHLVEARAADLRFTQDEAVAYFNGVMGLHLTSEDVTALERRTEGWIAALQLAALSMQGRDDVAGFISGFAGDDRYVVDYLVEEVLQRQSDRAQSFLLQTSILGRLSSPLCDAVTGRSDGKAMLEALDRGNLFLVPLDGRRQWYRYHRLFADVLHARLLDEQPDHVPELHRRASVWHQQNGDPAEAIRHAMSGGDFERAADLVEQVIPAMRRSRQDAKLRLWVEALPDELIRVRPVLSIAYAGTLMVRGEVAGVEERLRDAERWLDTTTDSRRTENGPPAGMVVVDHEAFADMPAAISLYRAGRALILGDVDGTVTHARRALTLVRDEDHVGRGGPAILLGLACWTSGDLEAAQDWYAQGMASLEKAGHHSDLMGCSIALADICSSQGRLRAAMSAYQRGLHRATDQASSPLRGAADMHVGIAQLLCERNELDAALHHLLTGEALGEHLGLPQNPYRRRVAMARILEARGDLGGALDLLHEAERVYTGDYSPNIRPVPALIAQLWAKQGNVAAALGWAREQGLRADDDITYLHEFEHITLARTLVALDTNEAGERSIDQAAGLLQRLLEAAEAGNRTGSVIEILVQQALVHQARGDVPAALEPLERALTLAEPEDYVRTFVDEGPPMALLLSEAAGGGNAPRYARRLLAAFGGREDAVPARQPLVEPLSEREIEVLRLLRTDLDGPDIARELVVSLHTVRSHTKKIYAKLGVNNRRAAVRRAEELDLLARTRSPRSDTP